MGERVSTAFRKPNPFLGPRGSLRPPAGIPGLVAWDLLFVTGGIAAAAGVLVRRWWFVAVAVLAAIAHAAWIVITGKTDEGSTGTLLVVQVVYLYAPALIGLVLGTWLGRLLFPPQATRMTRH